jgi:hypothetical protein
MRVSKSKERWKLALRLPSGHRYFRDLQHPGKVAIADDSGETPEVTDDGVLHLDRSRPVLAGEHGCVIPLTDPAGVQSATTASWREGILVAGHFNHRLLIELLPYADPFQGDDE